MLKNSGPRGMSTIASDCDHVFYSHPHRHKGAGDQGTQWVVQREGEHATRMEEDVEIEEGEALELERSPVDDLDSHLDYLDTKIADVLGDVQREFQGNLYPDKLGSRFGGYGTFLPTQVRETFLHTDVPPPAPTSDFSSIRQAEGQMERTRDMSGGGLGAACGKISKLMPSDKEKNIVPANGACHSTDRVAKDNLVKYATPAQRRKGQSLTLRIIQNHSSGEGAVQKVLCNSFGLTHSLSPPANEEDEVPVVMEEGSPERSPFDMIRIMSSHELPLGGLLSPLPHLLSGPREWKEKPMKYVKASKEKKAVLEKVRRKPLECNEIDQPIDSVKVGRKDVESDRTGKEADMNVAKPFQRVQSKCGSRTSDLKSEKTDRDLLVDGHDVRETGKDVAITSLKEKTLFLKSVKEEGSNFVNPEYKGAHKGREDLVKDLKKSRETPVEINVKDSTKVLGRLKYKASGNKYTQKARRDETCQGKTVQEQSQQEKVSESPVPENEMRKGFPNVLKGKESMEYACTHKEGKDKLVNSLKQPKKDFFKKEVVMRDVDGSGGEDIKESSGLPREVSKDPGKWDGMSQDLKDVRVGNNVGKRLGKESKSMKKERERKMRVARGPVGDGTGDQLPAPKPLLPFAVTTSNAETIVGASLPVGQLVLDNWVACDNCQQWRLLVPGVNVADFPEKWQCKMMTWLPGLNSCKFSEDVTTTAVYNYLGYQNPALAQGNPGLQAQQPLLVPVLAPHSELILENEILESKPTKVQRSDSKKYSGKKSGTALTKFPSSNMKRTETGSVKSKSLNDVVQQPSERGPDTTGHPPDESVAQVMAEKRKVKDKYKYNERQAQNVEINHTRSIPVDAIKGEYPEEDERQILPDLRKDELGLKCDKSDVGPHKDAKSNFGRLPSLGKGSHVWEGGRIGTTCLGRNDSDVTALRNGFDGQLVFTNANSSRSRTEGQQSGSGNEGTRVKGSQVDGALDIRVVDGCNQGKEHKKGADEDTGLRLGGAKPPSLSGQVLRGPEGSSMSPRRKEHSVLAHNLTKEAKDLKHSADRLKIVQTFEVESTNLYLQAALKFLQAGHHLEMVSVENIRQSEANLSMQMYIDTARLCDFCAATYERHRDLAAAALAHICAAVARIRVLMGKSAVVDRDCIELQNAASLAAPSGNHTATVQTPLAGLPPSQLPRTSEKPATSVAFGAASVAGNSPSSSSASDVDNLNNHAVTGEKGLFASAVKGPSLSPIPGSTAGSADLVPPRLHLSFQRVIRNGMDVHNMLESLMRAQSATAAAESAGAGSSRRIEGIIEVRKVAEIGLLGNMDAVVRQVRLALEAIGH